MAKKKKNSSKGSLKKALLIGLLILLGITGFSAYEFYSLVYKSNIGFTENDKYFYIPTGSEFKDVSNALNAQNIIRNQASFDWLSQQKNYVLNVKAGRYLLHRGMSNNELINLLRSGEQEPVSVTFNNIRFKEELAGKVATFIEADSTSIINLLNSDSFVSDYGFTNATFLTLFLPNTYEFWWNTSAEEFVARMAKEYKHFW
ncbi:endolytic transglycosylase MltG, partial [Bacteroidota bacterium]